MNNINLSNQLEIRKYNQVVRYTSYDIPKDIIESTFDKISSLYDDLNDLIAQHDIIMRQYIIDQLNEGNINMYNKIEKNNIIVKVKIIKNARYGYSKDIIDNVYSKAIQLLIYKFNATDGISINILNNMKYIINNNYINTSINKMDLKIYDISFLKKYIEIMNYNKEEILNVLDISMDEFDTLLEGKEKASIDVTESLCLYFDTDNINELKNMALGVIKRKKLNVESIREKLKEEPKKEESRNFIIKNNLKCYNLSFMKEYVELYNIRKDYLAEMFNCGIKKVDDILDGKTYINENLMSDVYIEFRVKYFLELKSMISKKIEIFKLNQLKNNLKVFYEKYNNLKIKDESMIGLMDKKLLSEVLELNKMSEIDRKIAKLIFKIGFDEDYTSDDIKMILNVEYEDIDRVKQECMQKINNIFEEVNNIKTKKLK